MENNQGGVVKPKDPDNNNIVVNPGNINEPGPTKEPVIVPNMQEEYKPAESDLVGTSQAPEIPLNTQIPPPFVDKFVSCLDIEVSPLKEHMLLKSKPEHRIKAWTTQKDYHLVIWNWVMQMLQFYDGIKLDIPWETDPIYEDRRRTKSGNIGFRLDTAIEMLKNRHREEVFRDTHAGSNYEVGNTGLRENVVVCGLHEEVQLQQLLSDINWNYGIIEIDMVVQWFKQLDNSKTWLAPIEDTVRPAFDKVWHVPVVASHYELMDLNREYREAVRKQIRAAIEKYMRLEKFSDFQTFRNLLELIQKRVNTFSETDSLPAKIISTRGELTLYEITTAILLGKWYKLEYKVDLTKFDMVTLLDCIVVKLITPKRIWSTEAITAIDNYIAYYLISKVKGFRLSNLILINEILVTNINYLSLLFEHGGLFGNQVDAIQDEAVLRAYLYTTDNGGGWSAAGFGPDFQIPNTNLRFHRNEFIHESITGKLLDWDMFASYPQLIRFSQFSNLLSKWSAGNKFIYYQPKYRAVAEIIQALNNNFSQFQAFSVYYEELLRQMSYNCLTAQISDADDEIRLTVSTDEEYQEFKTQEGINREDQRRAINGGSDVVLPSFRELSPGAFISTVFSINWPSIELFPNTHEWIEMGWNWNAQLVDFLSSYAIAKRYLPKEMWSKKDRVEEAFKYAKSTVLTPILKEAMLGRIQTYIIPIEGSAYMLSKLDITENLLLNDNRAFFGEASTVLYNGKIITDQANELNRVFKIHSVAERPISLNQAIGYVKFVDLLQASRLYHITLDANLNNTTVIFKVPVPLDYGDPTRDDFGADVYDPFGEEIRVRRIKVLTRWEDSEKRKETNEFALLRPPLWTTPDTPFMIITPEVLPQLLQEVVTLKRITIYDFSRFERRVRQTAKDGNPVPVR